MQYAYLGAAVLIFLVWLIFFLRRKDLHREMLTMSLLAAPLGFFDLWAVPLYWTPVTLGNIPVGVEGIIYSFCLGGITAVLYTEIARKTPVHMRKYHKSVSLLVLTAALVVLAILAFSRVVNPVIVLYAALLTGLGVALFFRKDLVRGTIFGALSFGLLYFIVLKVWITLFPGVIHWFHFAGLPMIYIWGVPLYEILFGTLFAALWGNAYELIFGYRLIAKGKGRKKR